MQLPAATEGNQVLSKSASLPKEPFENPQPFENSQQAPGTPAWKQEVNQRLAAHRTRRGSAQDTSSSQEGQSARAASDRAAAAAARVAARYAKAPSYSELLAGEARAVVRAAGAAAEAARNAQAAAQAVLAGLEAGFEAGHDSGPAPQQFWEPAPQPAQSQVQAAPRWQDEPPPAPAAQMRWQENSPAPATQDDVWSEMRVYPRAEPAPAYRRDAERDYRHHRGDAHTYETEESGLFSGEFASPVVEPVQHLPANLIEFPRELVATRKARPRLAEGPFYNPAQEEAQLNIFEVDPSQMSDEPAVSVAPPEWASIELDHPRQSVHAGPAVAAQAYAHMPSSFAEAQAVEKEAFSSYSFEAAPYKATAFETASYAPAQSAPPVQTVEAPRKAVSNAAVASAPELLVATVSDRLLAAVVDGALVTLAYLAAAVVVIASTAHPPAGRTALIASACGLALFWMLYEYLFLSYAEEGTPGMRYARIALCTFEDENPTLEQMRMRIPAMLLAALPGGLGLAWAFWDKEHLGWQDRLTKTYQRKY
jgi:uncharacterized RDD family membrane protein YckC